MIDSKKVSQGSMDMARAGDRAMSGRYRYMVVAILAAVYSLNFLDRQILSVLAEPIRKDLGLSDTQIGALGGIAFALFYTVFGVPIGWLADRFRRTWIIAGACALWSVFTMTCGAASGFVPLAVLRAGVAMGEAGGTAPSYSVISDYFPTNKRGTALGLFSIGGPLGVMLGTILGGVVAAHYGWRMAFVAAGMPGLIGAMALLVLVREPRRGGMDPHMLPARPPQLPEAIRAYFADPLLRAVTLATSLCAFVAYGATAWTAPFLIRVKGMSLSDIAVYYSLTLGVVGIVGTFASGWLVDRLTARNPRWYSLMPAIAFVLVVPFWLLMLRVTEWSWALAPASVAALLFSFYLTPALAVIQNAVPSGRRTVSASILLFVVNLVGLGGGPLFVGLISDRVKATFGVQSLSVGLLCLVPIMLLASLAQFRAARLQQTAALPVLTGVQDDHSRSYTI